MNESMPRVAVLADSDSYLKWAAGLFSKTDPAFDTELILVRGASEPSPAQVNAALRTTDWTAEDLVSVEATEVHSVLRGRDVVVLAVRGAMALVIGDSALRETKDRPVIVTGLPGMSIPAKRRGLVYRSFADLFVLHSKAEIEAFEQLASDLPLAGRFALATLPFTTPTVSVRHDPHGPFVFAVQAIVPVTMGERRRLAKGLLAWAEEHPDRDLIIKIRNADGEVQTHADTRPIPRLMREATTGGVLPPNVDVRAGAMVDVLDGAAGLITISSTAALEALEYGQPVALVSDFGVRKANLNVVFADSGLMTRLRMIDPDVTRWNRIDPAWTDCHYFHPEASNTWRERLAALIEQRREGELPEPVHATDVEFSGHQRLYWSATALRLDQQSRAQRAAVTRERRRRALKRARRWPQRTVKRVGRGVRWRVRRAIARLGG